MMARNPFGHLAGTLQQTMRALERVGRSIEVVRDSLGIQTNDGGSAPTNFTTSPGPDSGTIKDECSWIMTYPLENVRKAKIAEQPVN